MLKWTIFFSVLACFCMSAVPVMATDYVYWGSDVGPYSGFWSTDTDWDTGAQPIAGEGPCIQAGGTTPKPCVLDITTPVVADVWIYDGAVLKISSGGSLVTNNKLSIAYDTNSTAEMIIDGGSCYNSYSGHEAVRVGYGVDSNGTLTIINGGVLRADSLLVPQSMGATGTVKLYDGLIELLLDRDQALQLNYGPRTGGTIDIWAPSKLTVMGDRRTWELIPHMEGNDPNIFSTDPNTNLVLSFDGSKTIVQGITTNPATDFNRDNSVDFEDFAMFADVWQTVDATDINEPNPNRLIFAPENSGITVDGSFVGSEWDNASDWAVFGKSFPDGEGLASTTKARYVWNGTTNMLYIAIESTEPNEYAQFQVGGLMGNLNSDPEATASESWESTEIHFEYNGSSIDITNPYALGGYTGRTDGIVAAHTYSGGVFRLEIGTPIYSKWRTGGGSSMPLSAGMDIYTYINILSDNDGALRADSQCTRAGGEYGEPGDLNNNVGSIAFLYGGQTMSRGSAVRLLTSLPATCSDVPDGMESSFNFAGDCSIGWDDLAVFLEDWLK